MARVTNIKLRRAATASAVPTTSQLDLGEIALNTYDGKAYMKKDVGGTQSVVQIGSSEAVSADILKEYQYDGSDNVRIVMNFALGVQCAVATDGVYGSTVWT